MKSSFRNTQENLCKPVDNFDFMKIHIFGCQFIQQITFCSQNKINPHKHFAACAEAVKSLEHYLNASTKVQGKKKKKSQS